MSDRTRVQNPLTIIAIFAGIAEIAGTTVLLGLPLEIQKVFVWFVISFPFLLVGAFFAVLLFKHRVLYAPSDFSNEEHFISLLKDHNTAKHAISQTTDVVLEMKNVTKNQNISVEVMDTFIKRLNAIESELKEKGSSTILVEEEYKKKFDKSMLESYYQMLSEVGKRNPMSLADAHAEVSENKVKKDINLISNYLQNEFPERMTIEGISTITGIGKDNVKVYLNVLVKQGLVVTFTDESFAWWRKEE
ncbi:hypothetical protein ACE3MZ_12820 [Paenibacillus sp. WLX1005]|uniref:hypothetical protein n=1 Tax=Paenibacillus sp. WLX1005 TaxID=3243766 RepID=UPI00398437D9